MKQKSKFVMQNSTENMVVFTNRLNKEVAEFQSTITNDDKRVHTSLSNISTNRLVVLLTSFE